MMLENTYVVTALIRFFMLTTHIGKLLMTFLSLKLTTQGLPDGYSENYILIFNVM